MNTTTKCNLIINKDKSAFSLGTVNMIGYTITTSSNLIQRITDLLGIYLPLRYIFSLKMLKDVFSLH